MAASGCHQTMRQQVLRQNVRDVLEDFEGCGEEALEKSLVEVLGDDGLFDRFISGLGDDGCSWSMADLVLCWDEQEHDWSYAPAEERAIRSILGDLGCAVKRTSSGREELGRKLIIGDIHARYEKLRAVLGKARFDPAKDVLYSVGDFCDRGERPVETLDHIMGLGDSFRPVLGNHDSWLEYWLHTRRPDDNWTGGNGGDVTFRELSSQPEEWLERLKDWLSRIPLVRIEDDAIIVHGGISRGMDEAELGRIAKDRRPIPLFMGMGEYLDLVGMGIDMREYDRLEELYWNRIYLLSAMDDGRHRFISTGHGRVEEAVPPLDTERDIWIGHTQLLPSGKPFHSQRYHLYAIDTGAGSGMGPLTVADMDSKTFWQA